MATENPTWGYTRLIGALDNLGHQVGRNTVKRVLLRHGLDPAPVRGKRMSWKTFLRTHLGATVLAGYRTLATVNPARSRSRSLAQILLAHGACSRARSFPVSSI